jgi:MSHA pilin protein MshA
MKKQQGGFTLIELIMVIVILGILAAVALPRFADFSGQARYSSISAALGAVRSASAIVHSAALVGNQTGPTGSVTLENASIATVYGYIAGTAAALQSAAQLSSDYTLAAADGDVTVSLGGCSFTYSQATAAAAASIGTLQGATDGSCAATP